MTRISFVVIFLFFLTRHLNAQNEAQKWYFGNNTGLNFASAPPTPITGAMNGIEGTAVICNSAGNLLFYTDGMTVYNQQHLVMSNGSNLDGHFSTTQSSLIVKKPGSNSLYFLFTLDQVAQPKGLRYSIVDMSLASGLGAVTVKNATLYAPSAEKLAGVKHCNGIDTWVVSRDMVGQFRAYLVDASGINTNPVLSLLGSGANNFINTAGQLKFSPNGRKMGCAIWGSIQGMLSTSFEIYDFDPSSGIVSNAVILDDLPNAYGCEFSPDGSKFYGGQLSGNLICQWDLCSGNDQTVIASKVTFTAANSNAAMQLAPDGKIYVMHPGTTSLSVINKPNLQGNSCNFVNMQQPFGLNTCESGLPSFVASFFKTPLPPFTYTGQCKVASFNVPAVAGNGAGSCSTFTSGLNGVSWNFGDPSTGVLNTSLGTNPTHTFSAAGNYIVSMVFNYNCSSDTVKLPVVINAVPVETLSLAGTYSICTGQNSTFTVSGAASYTWSNGSTGSVAVLSPTVSTSFTVSSAIASDCVSKKTFTVTVLKCTGIYKTEAGADVKAYPNPFNAFLNIEAPCAMSCAVYNMVGELLVERKLEAGLNRLEMGGYDKGVYLFRFKTGDEQTTLRFVKAGD